MINKRALYELYDQGPEPFIRLVEDLMAHNVDIERQIGHEQRVTIQEMSGQIFKLKGQIERLQKKLSRQVFLNYELKRKLQAAEARLLKDSHNSSKPPSTDPPPRKKTKSLRGTTGKRSGGQPGHPGKTRLRSPRPDHVVTHRPQVCRNCQSSLANGAVMRSESRQVWELPPINLHITEHRLLKIRCDGCGARTKAAAPTGVKATLQYGPRLRALCVYLQNYQLLPLERTSQLLTDLLGYRISQATLKKMAVECATGLAEAEAEIKAELRRSPVLHADETSVRVNKAGHYVHVAATELLTHYGYHQQRGQSAMEEIGILPQFAGHVVHDGWWSYWQYQSCRHSLCVAHLLRELIYIEESHPHQRGVWAEPMAKLLLEIKQAVEAARRAGVNRLSEEQERNYHRRYDEIIEQAVELNPERMASTKEAAGKRGKLGRVRQTEARNLVGRLERYKSEVLRFMTDFAVPFDNNQAERDLRMLKLQQKTSGCFRTTEGARRFCRTRGVISTWRKQGRELFASLEGVFQESKMLPTS